MYFFRAFLLRYFASADEHDTFLKDIVSARMCGIFCRLSAHAHARLDVKDEERLRARGPDALHTHTATFQSESRRLCLTFVSSVLALRGDSIVPQPIVDDLTGSVFCWNGEAWSYDNANISENDTNVISTRLFNAIKQELGSEQAILDVLSKITGPYAFVFYDAKASIVYFGRDVFGRRSLLIQQDGVDSTELTVSSIPVTTTNSPARELDVLHIQKINLSRPTISIEAVPITSSMPRINKSLPADSTPIGRLPSETALANLLDELQCSLRPRVKGIATYDARGSSLNPSRVAVLFSGGLDCTLLARLVHDILPHDQPIDLLNVAFENRRVHDAVNRGKIAEYEYNSSPDRITGLKSHLDLARVCHERDWRFVAINVPYHEFLEHRPTVIQLMYPHNTEMDLSIASALYFAARGKGTMTSSTDANQGQEYTTTARVLLSGLGADELFGGYSRHASAFARGGYDALNNELELDFDRIGSRNLGRDDRVMSHWGRETRFPFLDENFVKFTLGLPAWEKCGFRPGIAVPKHFEVSEEAQRMADLHPEKMLLRCAAWQLGIINSAREKKRAIQFGAKSAKMHSGKTKGTDVVTVADVEVSKTRDCPDSKGTSSSA